MLHCISHLGILPVTEDLPHTTWVCRLFCMSTNGAEATGGTVMSAVARAAVVLPQPLQQQTLLETLGGIQVTKHSLLLT